jgi:hypothetical protein
MLPCLSVTFDSILNVLWMLLGLLALATTMRFTLAKGSRMARRRVWQSCAVVGLIAATLFPVVSATDDVLRIQHLQRLHVTGGSTDRRPAPAQKSSADSLIRLFESMDMPLMAVVATLLFTLLFVCFLKTLLQNGIDRENPSASGRSPPALLCA